MAYTSLKTYFYNLNCLKKVIKKLSIHVNLRQKILNLGITYKEFNNLLLQKHFDSKVLQGKLLCIYHNFTMEVFLQQVINNKNHTKTACSSRASFQYINKKTLQFYNGYFTNFYQMKL